MTEDGYFQQGTPSRHRIKQNQGASHIGEEQALHIERNGRADKNTTAPLAEAGRSRISARSDTGHVPAYHQRTAENMRRILETGPEEAAARLADLPLKPYQAGLLSNMFHKLETETA